MQIGGVLEWGRGVEVRIKEREEGKVVGMKMGRSPIVL